MQGRAFLDIAQELANGATEAHWRTAAGRAYYALMLEGRDALLRWSFTIPPRDNVHTFVRLRFTFAGNPDLKHIGYDLDDLSRLRNQADYRLATVGVFALPNTAFDAVDQARAALALLDQVDGDPSRRAAAIAAIQAAWP
jgi:hypothetical protein